jgi:large subunit ribosomal protein L40
MLPSLSRQPSLLPRLPLIWTRNAGRKARRGEVDPRKEQMKNILYPPNRLHPKDTSPTGCYRPTARRALRKIITNRTVHETIERAWLLHQRHVRKAREAEMQCKFDSMRRAMTELEHSYPHLAREANRKPDPSSRTEEETRLASKLKGFARRAMDARLPGLFPREMRPPTDTPPTGGWKHDWRPAASNESKVKAGINTSSYDLL